MLQRRAILIAASFAVLSTALMTLFVVMPYAHADGGGASGPGGGGSGSSDPAYTSDGYGWYQLTIGSPQQPKNFLGGGSWMYPGGPNERCAALGAKSIIAYLVYRPTGGLKNSAVANFRLWSEQTGIDRWAGYNGDKGAPWMTAVTAKARYDSVSFNKTGNIWGGMNGNVGWFCYNFSSNWSISGNSYIQKGTTPNKSAAVKGPITAAPGDTLNWFHDLRNTGPDNMDKQVYWKVEGSGFLNAWNPAITPHGFKSGTKGSLFLTSYASAKPTPAYSKYIVVANDAGKTLCQDIYWNPTSSTGGSGAGRSTNACAKIPYNYTLIPQISTSPSVLREGSGSIDVSATVKNTGSTISASTNWFVTRFVLAPGSSYTKSGIANAPCTQFSGYTGGSCQSIKNGVHTFNPGIFTVASFSDALVTMPPPGSQVCYLTSVDKGSATTSWKHSTVSCSIVERVPFVQILGNDLRVGSAFSGANVTAGATGFVFNNAGSWVEYGLLASGGVSGIASASGANGGNSGSQSAWSGLTFANTGTLTGCPSGFGCFAGPSNMGKIPDVSSFVKTAKYNGAALNYDRGSSSFNVSSIPSFIPGVNLSSFSQSASITTTGTVTIDQDITYNQGPFSSVNNIPQLIIIANNINVTGNVKNIDAWLITTGTLNTCSDVAPAALRTTNCTNPLTLHGATMASQLLLDRTYYDPSTPTNPAESANLRGSSYVWASNVARQNSQWQSVYSTDLPPRY